MISDQAREESTFKWAAAMRGGGPDMGATVGGIMDGVRGECDDDSHGGARTFCGTATSGGGRTQSRGGRLSLGKKPARE